MELKVKKLDQRAVLPSYQTEGAACFDITASRVTKWEGEAVTFGTDLAFDIPQDHVMLVFSRSGHGFKRNTRLANCVGVVDSDYTGEFFVKLTKDDENTMAVAVPGDRVAQAMILPVTQVTIVETDTLKETKRGANGLGSTGN